MAPPRLPVASRSLYDRRMSWDVVDALLGEMSAMQERKVLALARTLVPGVTPEDLRNPHDFVPLVESAEFNYEDGILAGLRAAEIAVRAARRDPGRLGSRIGGQDCLSVDQAGAVPRPAEAGATRIPSRTPAKEK